MNKYLLLLPTALCLIAAVSCGTGESQESETAEVTTTAEETTVTTEVTTEETTTTTTVTTVDYEIVKSVELTADAESVRPTSGKFALSNQTDAPLSYTNQFRIYNAETSSLLAPREEAENDPKTKTLGVGEETGIDADWTDQYGALEDGDYILELVLSQPEEAAQLLQVVQAKFTLDSDGFIPHLSIDPASVKPTGCVLTVTNATDVARSYGLVYRVYDETNGKRELLARQLDMDKKISKDYYMEPGASIQIICNWDETLGPLLEGDYAVEIDLLADNEKKAVPYRAAFSVVS
ncbi:MAG: hypothetical protein MJ071_01490 [Oscillospiraceae bacterium]|nr:hypothetical protein [Oscillospiraceae bacterium]